MTGGTACDAFRDALKQARAGTDGELELTETSEMADIKGIKQLHASYRSGNESLRLDTLPRALGGVGTVNEFECRGRGAGEGPRLVADVDIGGEPCQLIDHLG